MRASEMTIRKMNWRKKRMKKKLLSVVLTAAFCASMVFAGCGEAQQPADEQANVPATEQQEEVVTEEETEVVAEAEQVTLYLTRHGKTMLNATGRMQGWCDAPLTEDGAAVAEKLGQGLKDAGITFDAVYSSDSGRAYTTAELVLQNNGQEDLEIVKNPNMREVCFGIYEGATPMEAYAPAAEAMGYASVEEMMGDVMGGKITIVDAVTAMAETDETGAAETWAEATERVMTGLQEIATTAKANGQENVLVVSHGMSISSIIAVIDPSMLEGELENASITKIVFDGENFTVESVNDTSYIAE